MDDHIEIDLNITHHFSDGLYARKMLLPARHFLVTVDGDSRELIAPTCVTILANKHHQIVALEDAVWFCIHATNETDVDKIDEVLIRR